MKASEMVKHLEQAIADDGDREVEFFADHRVPPWWAFRPVQEIGLAYYIRGGNRHEAIVLACREWGEEKIRDEEHNQAARKLAMEVAHRGWWERFRWVIFFIGKPKPK